MKRLLQLKFLPYLLLSLLTVYAVVIYAHQRRLIAIEKELLIHLEDGYFVVVNEQENFIGGYPTAAKIFDEKGKPITLDALHIGDYLLITSKDGVLLHESPPPYRHILEIRKTGETNVTLAQTYSQMLES